MQFDFGSDIPLFLQVAEQIETNILSGAFAEESQVPSTTEISVSFKINPATVLKGMNVLVDDGLLYKKRGIGMFVADNAKKMIEEKRRRAFFDDYVVALLEEARKLKISQEELFAMIKGGVRHV